MLTKNSHVLSSRPMHRLCMIGSYSAAGSCRDQLNAAPNAQCTCCPLFALLPSLQKASSTAVVAPSSSSSRPQPHRGGFQAGTGRTSEDTMLQQDIIPPVPVKLADDQVPAFAENMVPSVEELVVTLCSITVRATTGVVRHEGNG